MDILFTTHYLAASALPSVGHELAVLTFYVETLRLFASRLLSLHFEGNTLECYWRIKFLNCCAFNITCSAFGPAHNVQGIYVNILWAGQTLEN